MAFLDGAQSYTSFQTQGFKNKKKKKKLGSDEVWIELLPPLFWTFTGHCEPFEAYQTWPSLGSFLAPSDGNFSSSFDATKFFFPSFPQIFSLLLRTRLMTMQHSH